MKDLKLPMLRDRYEGESMIVPGQEFVYGTTFQKDSDSVLGWYRHTVDPNIIVNAWHTDSKTFQNSWRKCYIAHVETKRTHQDEYSKRSYFLPVEDWDVSLKVADWEFIDISLIEFEEEDPEPIKSTLVGPGVSVTVIDESIYISKEMIDEWNYDRAMKVL